MPTNADFSPPAEKESFGKPFEGWEWIGTAKLATFMPADGILRGPGPASPTEFAFDNKLPWFRTDPGFSRKDDPLTVTGRRLDGHAPAFTETFLSSGFEKDLVSKWDHGRDRDPYIRLLADHSTLQKDKPDLPRLGHASPERGARERLDHCRQPQPTASLSIGRLKPSSSCIASRRAGVGITATVLLHGVIGNDGRPHEIQYVLGPEQLAQAAIDAVRWRQHRINDPTAEIDTTIEVAFSPSEN